MTAATTRAGFLDAMSRIAGLLEAGDVRVFYDAAEINPPGVLIQPPTMHYRFRRGDITVEYVLIALVGHVQSRQALAQLNELVSTVQELLGDRIVTGRPASVFLADQSAELRAYELTFTDTVRSA